MSIREKLLGGNKPRSEVFEDAELEVTAKVLGMSYEARTIFLRECMLPGSEDRLDMAIAAPRAIIETFVDPLNGQPVFTAADRGAIGALSPELVERMRVVVWRVIGLDAGELEKNSAPTEGVVAPSV